MLLNRGTSYCIGKEERESGREEREKDRGREIETEPVVLVFEESPHQFPQ